MPKDFSKCIRHDFRVVDSQTKAKLVSKNNTSGSAEVECEITGAVKCEIDRQEVIASNGFFTGSEVIFDLPVVADAWWPEAREPKEADTVQESPVLGEIEDGPVYSILIVTKEDWGTIWRCVCRQEK